MTKTLITLLIGTSLFLTGCTINLNVKNLGIKEVDKLYMIPKQEEYFNPNNPHYKNIIFYNKAERFKI